MVTSASSGPSTVTYSSTPSSATTMRELPVVRSGPEPDPPQTADPQGSGAAGLRPLIPSVHASWWLVSIAASFRVPG